MRVAQGDSSPCERQSGRTCVCWWDTCANDAWHYLPKTTSCASSAINRCRNRRIYMALLFPRVTICHLETPTHPVFVSTLRPTWTYQKQITQYWRKALQISFFFIDVQYAFFHVEWRTSNSHKRAAYEIRTMKDIVLPYARQLRFLSFSCSFRWLLLGHDRIAHLFVGVCEERRNPLVHWSRHDWHNRVLNVVLEGLRKNF